MLKSRSRWVNKEEIEGNGGEVRVPRISQPLACPVLKSAWTCWIQTPGGSNWTKGGTGGKGRFHPMERARGALENLQVRKGSK